MWYDARAADLGLAAGDVGDRRRAEDIAQRLDALGPDAAGLAGFLADLAVERLDDLDHADLIGGPGEAVAALDAALAGEQAIAAQGREELLEELDRHPAALGDLGDRHRTLSRPGQLGHRDDGVAGL